jgi:short-subunit dehydrogenase
LIVLITGASSGLGRGLVVHYLREGHTVAAIARRPAQLERLRQEADSGIGRLEIYPGDVTNRLRIAEIVATAERRLGPIDLAIAGAGIAEQQLVADLDLDGLERMLATNVLGAFYTLAPVLSAMRIRGHGHLAAISSLAAVQPVPRFLSYSASKAALNAELEGLYWLLRPYGIGVTTVCPGFVATEMTEGLIPPLWCMPPERAVLRIADAIRRRQRQCYFPFWLYLALRALRLMPEPIKAFIDGRWDARVSAYQRASRERPRASSTAGAEH